VENGRAVAQGSGQPQITPRARASFCLGNLSGPMSESTTPTFRLRVPDAEEFETVEVKFTPDELPCLRQFIECSDALCRTSIVKRGFPITINLSYGEGKLAANWSRPTDDEMAAYLLRYRPFGLQNESTYFYKIVNILSKRIDNTNFRSSLRSLRDMFSGKHMQDTTLKVEANNVILNSDTFFMDWLNGYQYHRAPDAIQKVEAVHTIMPLRFTEALMVTLMSEKTGAITRVSYYARALIS
jgi:hypothetical protein